MVVSPILSWRGDEAGAAAMGENRAYAEVLLEIADGRLKLAEELQRPDVIVVDPPRPGLHPAAREAVIDHKASKVVYVSCNTATFARDLAEFLKAGYELRTVQPVDLFPHTSHIETVALLQRK